MKIKKLSIFLASILIASNIPIIVHAEEKTLGRGVIVQWTTSVNNSTTIQDSSLVAIYFNKVDKEHKVNAGGTSYDSFKLGGGIFAQNIDFEKLGNSYDYWFFLNALNDYKIPKSMLKNYSKKDFSDSDILNKIASGLGDLITGKTYNGHDRLSCINVNSLSETYSRITGIRLKGDIDTALKDKSTVDEVRDILYSGLSKRFSKDMKDVTPVDLKIMSESIDSLDNDGGTENVGKVIDKASGGKFKSIGELKTFAKTLYDNKVKSAVTDNYNNKVSLPYFESLIKTNGILSDSSAQAYDKYKAIVYSLTGDKLANSVVALVEPIIDDFLKPYLPAILINHVGDKLLNKVINTYKLDPHVSSVQQVYLDTVVGGRGSQFEMSKASGLQLNSYYKGGLNIAQNVPTELSNIMEAMKSMTGGLANNEMTQLEKMMLTLPYRLQYAYYAMQNNMIDIDADVWKYSTESGEGKFNRFIPPVEIQPAYLSNPRAYMMFNNIGNEFTLERETLMGALGTITKDKDVQSLMASPTITNQVTYLSQMKSSITFLQGLNLSNVNVKPLIDYWFEVDAQGNSLELLYQTLASLGFKASTSFEYKNTGGAGRALGDFFDPVKLDLNDFLKMGIAQSSTYIPLQTNVYESSSYKIITNKEFYKFHNIYGYYRKALYMDSSSTPAVDKVTTGKSGNLKVAKLSDVINPNSDIVLYSGTNFYNTNKLADMLKQAYTKVQNPNTVKPNVKPTFVGDIMAYISKTDMLDLDHILKNGANTDYSSKLGKLTDYKKGDTTTKDGTDEEANADQAVLNSADIDTYIKQEKYSVLQPFAFLSATYRDKVLYDFTNTTPISPVFVASENVTKISSASEYDKSSIFNYALLKNIESNQTVNYSSNLDLNSPIYIDIYGNILTESGYVIVPSASNATLQLTYSPYTAGFISTYGKKYNIPSTIEFPKKFAKTSLMFEKSKDGKVWEFSNSRINSKIDINRLSVCSKETLMTLNQLYTTEQFKKGNMQFDSRKYIRNVFMEVMRGAPMSNIDKSYEGISSTSPITNSSIMQAIKLDNLSKALNMKGENAIISVPNIAFMTGIEYIILYAYKFIVIIVLVLIFIEIYISAVTFKFGIKSLLSIFMIITLTISTVWAVPQLFNLTYYQSNKSLLQKESEYIAMINLEKESSGAEIGMTSINAPDLSTSLLLKIKDIKVPWYKLTSDIITAPIGTNLNKIYKEYVDKDLATGNDSIQLKNGGLYISTNDLFKSSTITFNETLDALYQRTYGDMAPSFYLPYYAILDSLISNVNKFDASTNTYAYSASLYRNGELKSIGLIKSYFTSDGFLKDSTDILNLRQVYNLPVVDQSSSAFTQEEIKSMQKSYWCDVSHSTKDVEDRIGKINGRAREFLIENRDLLGRVSDETFLKVMALDLSMYHNNLFGVDSCQSLDIYNLSSEDLTRLSIADRGTVMKTSPMSFSRFILEVGGEPGIYLAGFLELLSFALNFIKPIVTLLLFLEFFLSIFLYKLVFRKRSENIKGFVIIMFLVCGGNLLYSLILKASLYLPSIIPSPFVCMFLQIIFYIAAMSYYIFIFIYSITSWRDLAYNKMQVVASRVIDTINSTKIMNKIKYGSNKFNKVNGNGWEVLEQMEDSDTYRDGSSSSSKSEIGGI